MGFSEENVFNRDPIKQAIEVCFSHKEDKAVYPPLQFNNNDIQSANSQKHLRLVLDSKLDFNEHVNNKINKCNKSIGIIKKLSLTLSRNSLFTIYKTTVGPILDYIDYDKPLTESFKDRLEMVQYNAALVITGAVKGTSHDHIYRELGLESLAEQRWSRKIFLPQNNKWSFTSISTVIYYCGVTVVKEFIVQDQQIKRAFDNSLHE